MFQFASNRELQDLILDVNSVLSNEKSEWEQRVHAVGNELLTLLIAFLVQYPIFVVWYT